MSSRPPRRSARRCPICGRPLDAKFKPFCSKHCADVDLARWLGGGYAIPAQEEDDSGAGEGAGDGEDKP
jgi:hypothetical protein